MTHERWEYSLGAATGRALLPEQSKVGSIKDLRPSQTQR